MRPSRGLFVVFAALLAVLAPASADPIRNVRVQFAQGTSGATMHGHIEGRELIDYRLNVRAGQMMHLHLETRHTGTYFNVFEPRKTPGQDAAYYIGATGGNTVEFRTSHSGDYLIRVFMVAAAARRGESANYTLEVRIGNEEPPSSAGTRDAVDARVARTDFQATGQLPCARNRGQPMASCRFGVRREGNGNGWITVFWPDGGNRVIFFEDNTPVRFDQSQADGNARMTVGHEADLYHVRIGAQRFEIPAAVMTGG